MAIDNFIPEIWSDQLKEDLRKNLVLANLCTTQWSGAIANVGDTVNILGVVNVTVSAYDPAGTLSYGDLTDEVTQLVVDQADAFAFRVGDIDAFQAMPGLVETATSQAADDMADKMEQYIFSLVDTAAEVGTLIDAATTTATADNIAAYMGDVVVALDEANVPQAGRWGIVSPAVYNLIRLAAIGVVQSVDAFDTGEVINVFGITLYKSNNVPSTDSTHGIKCLFGQGPAIAIANQISQVEAIRLEGSFANAIRGLNVYGAKVIDKNRLVILDVDTAA